MIPRVALLCALALPGLAGPSVDGGQEWLFTFANGDRVHGQVRGIRGSVLLLQFAATPSRAVAVRLRNVTDATRVNDESSGEPANGPAPQIMKLRDGTVLLGRFDGIKQGQVQFDVESIGAVSLGDGEIAELLPTADVVRAYYRSNAPRRGAAAPQLSAERFDALWSYLGRGDPNQAWVARAALVRAGTGALPWLAERLARQPDAPSEIGKLIRALDADRMGVRRRAQDRLRALGRIAEPVLREALKNATSPEVRKRARLILAELDTAEDGPAAPEVARFLRAIRVVEEIGGEEAHAMLHRLANGATSAPTTRDAQAALDRLALRD